MTYYDIIMHLLGRVLHVLGPVRNPRFGSFRTKPFEILCADSEFMCYYLSTKGCLGNPTLGTNLGQRILATPQVNLPTNIVDFRGFDSSTILDLRGEITRPKGNLPESLSQAMYTVLYYTILYCTILYYSILYYTVPYHTIPYHTIPYHTIPYHTILYYTILYYTILYYTRLDFSRVMLVGIMLVGRLGIGELPAAPMRLYGQFS